VIGHPVLDTTGHITEYIGTVVDVTDRKRAEAERERLHQLEADLAHINRVSMMWELSASIAHELNQPITAAITNANTCLLWLKRDQPDLEEAQEAAARVVMDGNRAAETINRMRSFYKKGAPAQPELVDVGEIIREMTALLRSEAARWSISVHLKLADCIPNARADRVQLQQVFMNLMLNAIEAMRETGGNLEISMQVDHDKRLLIAVSDTGVGLPAAKANMIFDAFFTTKPQGTGMGLAITRSIIEAHGGRLWATDNPGRGATFQFTLPPEGATQA
jgi:signal transduction histidine kinase